MKTRFTLCWLVALFTTGGLARAKESISLASVAPEILALLETQHFAAGTFDDERSSRVFDAYFEALDPAKLYFRQSDIDAFDASRDELDDAFRSGELGFATSVGERFRARVDEVSSLVGEVLGGPLDFSRNEYLLRARDEARFAASDADLRELWRKKVKSMVLEQVVGAGRSTEEARDSVARELDARHASMRDITPGEHVRLYIDVVTSSYDPHTRFLPPDDLEDLQVNLRLRLVGIGVLLRAEKGRTLVSGLVPDGPAQREGTLREGDEIIAVAEGAQGTWVELAGRKLKDVVHRIRGEEGSTIRLRIRREGSKEPLTAKIRRGRVRLRQQEGHGAVLTVDGPGAKEVPVGVLRLPTFYGGTEGSGESIEETGRDGRASSTSDARRWIEEFERRDVEVIVLDLRGNAGGLLEEAVGVAGLFLDGGAIVQIAERGRVRVIQDRDGTIAWDGPLVVLTDRRTASASEIVAGALQDHGRALVVGDRSTHGKGTVQTLAAVVDAETGVRCGALKLTTGQFYLPSGPSPQQLGVVPNVVLPSRAALIGRREADLAGALPFDEIAAAPGVRSGTLPLDALSSIITSSQARRRSSAWFQAAELDLDHAMETREERWVPLERGKYEARLVSRPTAPEGGAGKSWTREPSIERDAYLDEVLAIAGDYLRSLRAK